MVCVDCYHVTLIMYHKVILYMHRYKYVLVHIQSVPVYCTCGSMGVLAIRFM